MPNNDPNADRSTNLHHTLRLCQELQRTIRGYNGEPGLLTQVALLQKEMMRLRSLITEHLQQHDDDRRLRSGVGRRIGERLLVWAIIMVLHLAAVGATVRIVNHIDRDPQPAGAVSSPPPPIKSEP